MSSLVSKLRYVLLHELENLKTYGVDNIGYRYFLSDGRSFGLPTSSSWYEKNRDESFYKIMKPFLTEELLRLSKLNYHYVSRSAEHDYSEYIQCLKIMKMENSIGIYKFAKNRIDSFFFIFDSNVGPKRDLIFNNFRHIENKTNTIITKLQNITGAMEMYDNYEFLLDAVVIEKLFKNDKQYKNIKLIVEGREAFLTQKETMILKSMKYYISNKNIADDLGISPSTVEKHLCKLKLKLGVYNRDKLLKIAQSDQLSTLINRELL